MLGRTTGRGKTRSPSGPPIHQRGPRYPLLPQFRQRLSADYMTSGVPRIDVTMQDLHALLEQLHPAERPGV